MKKRSCYSIRFILYFIGSLLLGMANAETLLTVKTKVVSAQTIDTRLYYHGVIEPIQKDVMISPFNGTLVKLNVHYGDTIKQGQPIAQLNAPEVEKEYHAQLSVFLKAKDSYLHAQKKYVSEKSLYDLGIIPKNELLDAKSDMASMFIAYNEAQKSFHSLLIKLPSEYRMNIDLLSLENISKIKSSFSLDFTSLPLISPFSGSIMMSENQSSDQQNFRIGKDIKAGDVLVEVADLSGISAKVYVNEADIVKIKPHQLVEIFMATRPDIPIVGEVVHLDSQGLRASKDSEPKFEVTIAAKNLTQEQRRFIFMGMSAKFALHLKHENVFPIPIESVIHQGQQFFVRVVRNKKIYQQRVNIVATTLQDALVSSGIVEHEHVVIQ